MDTKKLIKFILFIFISYIIILIARFAESYIAYYYFDAFNNGLFLYELETYIIILFCFILSIMLFCLINKNVKILRFCHIKDILMNMNKKSKLKLLAIVIFFTPIGRIVRAIFDLFFEKIEIALKNLITGMVFENFHNIFITMGPMDKYETYSQFLLSILDYILFDFINIYFMMIVAITYYVCDRYNKTYDNLNGVHQFDND